MTLSPIPEINLTMEAQGFRHMINMIATHTKADVRLIVRDEAVGLLKQIIQFTPPFGEAYMTASGSMRKPHGKTVGKNAVNRDIRRALNPMLEEDWNNPRIKDIIRNKDAKAMAAVLDNSKYSKSKGMQHFTGDIKTQHLSKRDRYGRVRTRANVFTFEGAETLSYIKKVQKRVGMAKGSWGKALALVGGKPTSWTIKALAESSQTIHKELNLLNDPVKPSLTVTSMARGVKDNPRLDHAIKGALHARTMAMVTKLKRLINQPGKTNYYRP